MFTCLLNRKHVNLFISHELGERRNDTFQLLPKKADRRRIGEKFENSLVIVVTTIIIILLRPLCRFIVVVATVVVVGGGVYHCYEIGGRGRRWPLGNDIKNRLIEFENT